MDNGKARLHVTNFDDRVTFDSREARWNGKQLRMSAKDNRVVIETPTVQATAGSVHMADNCLVLEGDVRFSYRNKGGSRAEVSGAKVLVRFTEDDVEFQVFGAGRMERE